MSTRECPRCGGSGCVLESDGSPEETDIDALQRLLDAEREHRSAARETLRLQDSLILQYRAELDRLRERHDAMTRRLQDADDQLYAERKLRLHAERDLAELERSRSYSLEDSLEDSLATA